MKPRIALSTTLTLFLLTTLGASTISPQENLDNYRDCPMEGSAKSECTQDQNRLKNRWNSAPSDNQINADITLGAILEQGDDEDRWSNDDGAEITGYVASIEATGPESCNCGSDADGETDFHINVVASPQSHSDCSRMIVEITPRWQHLKSWTFDQVKHDIEHKWVKFLDFYHLRESLNTRHSNGFKCGGKNGPFNCNGPRNKTLWRRTAWEIHPVTSYSVLSGPPH